LARALHPSVLTVRSHAGRKSDFTVVYLFVGCFVFGGYILWALCAGRPNPAVLRAIRRPLFAFRGTDVTLHPKPYTLNPKP